MGVRKTTPDPSTTELARRRLSQLGAELAASPSPPQPAGRIATTAAPGPAREPAGGPVPVPDTGAGAQRPSFVEQMLQAGSGRHARQPLPAANRMLARAFDALPPSMHGHLGVTSQHVTVVALVLAAAMALAAWLVIRATPQPVRVPQQVSLRTPAAAGEGTAPVIEQPPPVPPSSALADVTSVGPTPAATTAELVVHVIGKVRNAGIVELPAGSRVVDAIEAAGGARRHAGLATLNLARPLVDGEQIAVGVGGAVVPPSPSGAVVSAAPTALVNLNTATQLELEELPGVGPVTATSIIEWRTEHGGFSTVDELIEVSGIGEVTLAELRDLVTI